uniref:CMRF35-like molecule 1 n=1 Tax=Paramormyrops kingsleyae TaxID=1676925 RepID=A0A3B3Q522_9TELE
MEKCKYKKPVKEHKLCCQLLMFPGNFHTVLAGVSTVKWMRVQRRGSVTIPCFYDDRYKTNVKYWCRGKKRKSCTPIVHSDSPQEGKVSVRDDPDQRVFTVTINNFTDGDSGYYWCCVKINGASDPGDQVSLSVTDGEMFVLQTVANELKDTNTNTGGINILAFDDLIYNNKYQILVFDGKLPLYLRELGYCFLLFFLIIINLRCHPIQAEPLPCALCCWG